MINKDRLIKEFLALVQVASPSGQERAMATLLKSKLHNLGLTVYEDDAGKQVGATAGNLIVTIPANSLVNTAAPVLLFSAHMDTVEPGRGIQPVIKDGVISSAGATVLGADDKAGVAAILEAIRIILEQDIKHNGLEIIFSIWEEGGLKGIKALDYSGIKSKIGYVLDSDGDPGTIITAAPTHNQITATIKGRAAHAGQCPEDGISAILVAARAIAKMNTGRIDPETTANIGIIRGGQATNIVPDQAYLEAEARSLSAAKLATQTQQMVTVLEQEAATAGAQVEIAVIKEYDLINLDATDPVVQYAVTAAKKLGLKSKLSHTGGGSDASVLNSRGISCAVLGIGMNKVHTVHENIKTKHLCQVAELVVAIVKVANEG